MPYQGALALMKNLCRHSSGSKAVRRGADYCWVFFVSCFVVAGGGAVFPLVFALSADSEGFFFPPPIFFAASMVNARPVIRKRTVRIRIFHRVYTAD